MVYRISIEIELFTTSVFTVTDATLPSLYLIVRIASLDTYPSVDASVFSNKNEVIVEPTSDRNGTSVGAIRSKFRIEFETARSFERILKSPVIGFGFHAREISRNSDTRFES